MPSIGTPSWKHDKSESRESRELIHAAAKGPHTRDNYALRPGQLPWIAGNLGIAAHILQGVVYGK